eukprot:COSAG06_NODE_7005_length_2663_cov_8.500581_4_plen_68_part_01
MGPFPLPHVPLLDLQRLQVSRQVEDALLKRRQVLCAPQVVARDSVGWDWRYLGFPTKRAVFVRLDRVL